MESDGEKRKRHEAIKCNDNSQHLDLPWSVQSVLEHDPSLSVHRLRGCTLDRPAVEGERVCTTTQLNSAQLNSAHDSRGNKLIQMRVRR